MKRALLWAFVAATIGHLLGLYWPRIEVDAGVPSADKWAHFIGFGVPVALGWLALTADGRRLGRWLMVAAFVAHCGISELLQDRLLPNRTGDPLDALADLGGVVLGLGFGAATWWVVKRVRAPAHP